jgi:hypothetical protein
VSLNPLLSAEISIAECVFKIIPMTQYSAQEAIEKRQKKFKSDSKSEKSAGMEQADLVVRDHLLASTGSQKQTESSYFSKLSPRVHFLHHVLQIVILNPFAKTFSIFHTKNLRSGPSPLRR